jgi:hypothetical protein
MLLFISASLFLGFWVKNGHIDDWLFLSPTMHYTGITLMLINLIAVGINVKKISFALRYDLFTLGSLLVWFTYWPPFFREGSPVLYTFPLYFAFISATFSLLFMTQRESISKEDISILTGLPGFVLSNPLFIMLGVIVALALPQHFMLYPIAITLLIIRFFLECHLNDDK